MAGHINERKKGRKEDLKDGWLDGRTMDGRKELRIEGWLDCMMDGQMGGRKDGRQNVKIDERKDGRMIIVLGPHTKSCVSCRKVGPMITNQ